MYRVLLVLLMVSVPAWAGDPTRPIVGLQSSSAQPTGNQPISGLTLQQIVFRQAVASVVINGKLYRLGDEVAGYTLTHIEQNHVILNDVQKNEIKLPLLKVVSGLVVRETE